MRNREHANRQKGRKESTDKQQQTKGILESFIRSMCATPSLLFCLLLTFVFVSIIVTSGVWSAGCGSVCGHSVRSSHAARIAFSSLMLMIDMVSSAPLSFSIASRLARSILVDPDSHSVSMSAHATALCDNIGRATHVNDERRKGSLFRSSLLCVLVYCSFRVYASVVSCHCDAHICMCLLSAPVFYGCSATSIHIDRQSEN